MALEWASTNLDTWLTTTVDGSDASVAMSDPGPERVSGARRAAHAVVLRSLTQGAYADRACTARVAGWTRAIGRWPSDWRSEPSNGA